MNAQPLRIRLNVTQVNIPAYKYIWFPVSLSTLSTISDLKVNICKKFNLRRSIQLFVDGGLLQDEDTVLLLRENDVVEVVYKLSEVSQNDGEMDDDLFFAALYSTTQAANRAQKQKNEEMNLCSPGKKEEKLVDFEVVDLCDDQLDATPPPKRRKSKKKKKDKDLDFLKNFSLIPSTSKYSESQDIITSVAVDLASDKSGEKTTTCAKHQIEVSKQPKNSKSMKHQDDYDCPASTSKKIFSSGSEPMDKVNINYESFFTGVTESTPATVLGPKSDDTFIKNSAQIKVDPECSVEPMRSTNCKKKKKRKRRRKKDSTLYNLDSTPSFISTLEYEPFKKNHPNDDRKSTHIKFTSKSESSDSETLESNVETVNSDANRKLLKFSTCLESNNSSSGVMDSSTHHILNETDIDTQIEVCDSVIIRENLKNKENFSKPKNVSGTKCANHVNGTGDLIVNSDGIAASVKQPALKEMLTVGNRDYSQYTKLNTLPLVGTHIAFKILELSELYCPEISGYKEGMIVGFDPATDEVTIELIQDELKAPRDGKFENIYPDETPRPQVVRKITSRWTELIDPRAVSSKLNS